KLELLSVQNEILLILDQHLFDEIGVIDQHNAFPSRTENHNVTVALGAVCGKPKDVAAKSRVVAENRPSLRTLRWRGQDIGDHLARCEGNLRVTHDLAPFDMEQRSDCLRRSNGPSGAPLLGCQIEF